MTETLENAFDVFFEKNDCDTCPLGKNEEKCYKANKCERIKPTKNDNEEFTQCPKCGSKDILRYAKQILYWKMDENGIFNVPTTPDHIFHESETIAEEGFSCQEHDCQYEW